MGQGDGAQALKFDGQGLIPAVVQDWLDGTVLMVGYMNQDSTSKRFLLIAIAIRFW
jgi:phosphoribosyl-ATP pyrophosphohydrolase/phosphoribosyl-AMP cyclohydrolase